MQKQGLGNKKGFHYLLPEHLQTAGFMVLPTDSASSLAETCSELSVPHNHIRRPSEACWTDRYPNWVNKKN